jgi:hypothetical protein
LKQKSSPSFSFNNNDVVIRPRVVIENYDSPCRFKSLTSNDESSTAEICNNNNFNNNNNVDILPFSKTPIGDQIIREFCYRNMTHTYQ